MMLNPNERQTAADRVRFTLHLNSQLSSNTLLFASSLKITQSVFYQFSIKSASKRTGNEDKNVTDFAQDPQTDPTHSVVTSFLNTVENRDTTLGQTGVTDQLLALHVQLRSRVRELHP